jgi:cell division protein FtsW
VKRGQLDSSVLILVTLGLVAFGLVMVYSATSASAALANGDPAYYLKRQGIYAALGLVLMAAASRLDFRILRRLAPVLVVASLGLLLAVLVIGQSVNGARRPRSWRRSHSPCGPPRT